MKRATVNELAREIYTAALGNDAGEFEDSRKSVKTFYRKIARWMLERADRRREEAREALLQNPGPLGDRIRWTEVEFAEGASGFEDEEVRECLLVVPVNVHPDDELGQAELLALLFGWITTETPDAS